MLVEQWGWSTAIPIPADYDGDGLADIAVYHPATATWYISFSGGGSETVQFGWSAVVPIPADYDGDGAADVAVYHQAGGSCYIRKSSTEETILKALGGLDQNSVLLIHLIHSWFRLL